MTARRRRLLRGFGEQVYQIQARNFVAGFVVKQGTVVSAAPIIRYLLNHTIKEAFDYAYRKKGEVLKA